MMNHRTRPTVKDRKSPFSPRTGASVFLALIIGAAITTTGLLSGQDASVTKKAQVNKAPPAAAAPSSPQFEAAVVRARERAKLLHDVYSSTLDVMHHRYFRPEGAVLPSRALEDVFEEMDAMTGDKANWISVNTKAMSIDHEPTTEFEKKAAAELAAGKEAYEFVSNGTYQRAAPISLRSSCVGCHTKMFSDAPKTPRLAGLVISIPLKLKKK